MKLEPLLTVVILSCAMLAFAACKAGGDANQPPQANELEAAVSGPIDRGAPGNPRGPTDPSR
jgi:hypothetical protein